MKISKELYTFFKAYKKWADDGAKNDEIFTRSVGLCHNLRLYHKHKYLHYSVNAELRKLLENKFGDAEYPFGEFSYEERKSEGTQHLCPERMAFVDKCIEAYESTGKEEKVVKSESKCSFKFGDKVNGVEFTQDEYPSPGWAESMARYLGKVGTVIDTANGYTSKVYVRFEDGNSWWYPAHLLKKVEDNEVNKQPAKKESAPKSVWGVIDTETGNVISVEITHEKARQMKAHLNGEFKIAKMVFDKWVR